MRVLLFLLLLSPSLIYAGCGDCDEVHAEIERETEMDSTYHECRNCKKVTPDMDDIETNCPSFGSVCENKFYTSTLSATRNCECLIARCAPNAKLWVNVDGVPVQKSKMNCNNSQWMVDGKVFESATCAKNCDKGACKTSHPKALASGDFTALIVTPASATAKCAMSGTCPYGTAAINADGTLMEDFFDPDPSTDELTCTGEGKWTFNPLNDVSYQYIMCIASKCGPLNCMPFVFGNPFAELVTPKVTGKGADCAKATCPGSVFVKVTDTGDPGEEITGVTELTCTETGEWSDGTTAVRAMCKMPPCKEDCSSSTTIKLANGQSTDFIKPIRKGCDYTCMGNHGLFYYDTHLEAPVSIDHTATPGHIGSTCVDGEYTVNSTLSVTVVGCYACSFGDGPLAASTGEPGVTVDHCVLSCPDKYKLQYTNADSMRLYVNSLYVAYSNSDDTIRPYLYDAERGMTYPYTGTGAITEYKCVTQ